LACVQDMNNVENKASGAPLHKFIGAFRFGLKAALGRATVKGEFGTLAGRLFLGRGRGGGTSGGRDRQQERAGGKGDPYLCCEVERRATVKGELGTLVGRLVGGRGGGRGT
jgi:hypothetical protein